uniref:Uncharacterized protein n=1 Tax=Anguilla anguilla TaxID=7936 RepID=A0A0E9R9J5_ANGAN
MCSLAKRLKNGTTPDESKGVYRSFKVRQAFRLLLRNDPIIVRTAHRRRDVANRNSSGSTTLEFGVAGKCLM